LARRNDTPIYILNKLSNSNVVNVLKNLGYNKITPSEILDKLIKSEISLVREACIFNENLSDIALNILSEDPYEKIRQQVAYRSNLPKSIQYRLIQDSSWLITPMILGYLNMF
jgi:hypothetical protein